MTVRDVTTHPVCVLTRPYQVGTAMICSPPLTREMKTAIGIVTPDLEEHAVAGVEHPGEEDDVELSVAALCAPSYYSKSHPLDTSHDQISLIDTISSPLLLPTNTYTKFCYVDNYL